MIILQLTELSQKKFGKRQMLVMIFGNGAGASIASHFANDLTTKLERVISY